MRKLKFWIKTEAGTISTVLFIVSIILIVTACLLGAVFEGNSAANINNILLGAATNLWGIIVTVSFVQYFIDKQDEKREKAEEVALIKRYHRVMSVLIKRYLMYRYCVITPIDQRQKGNPYVISCDFSLLDMKDLYQPSTYICEGLGEPSIFLFYKAEKNLRKYMIDMIENINFKYNEELYQIILSFIENSINWNMRGAILGNVDMCGTGENSYSSIVEGLMNTEENWIERWEEGTLTGNIMFPYVTLYKLIKTEMELLLQYDKYINQL